MWNAYHCNVSSEVVFSSWMDILSCLLCFAIRYFQLQVTENSDSTSSNNEGRIMSPNKKPGGWVVLGRFTHRVSVGTRQPGSSNPLISGLTALPPSHQGCRRTEASLPVSSHWNNQRQIKRTFILCLFLRSAPQRTSPYISRVKKGPQSPEITPGLESDGTTQFALQRSLPSPREWRFLTTLRLCLRGGRGWTGMDGGKTSSSVYCAQLRACSERGRTSLGQCFSQE